jgi:hypothetical protein
VDSFLAQSIKTLVARKGLFSLLEDLAAHVDELDLVGLVCFQEFSNSF